MFDPKKMKCAWRCQIWGLRGCGGRVRRPCPGWCSGPSWLRDDDDGCTMQSSTLQCCDFPVIISYFMAAWAAKRQPANLLQNCTILTRLFTYCNAKCYTIELPMSKQVGNQNSKSLLRWATVGVGQTLSNSVLWSLVMKYFGEAVLHPSLACCSRGQLPFRVPRLVTPLVGHDR